MTNPLLTASTLPLGLPAFADIRPEHFPEAFDAGMAEHLAQVRAIADADTPATFENTIVALERSGDLLSRASMVFFNLISSVASAELQAIETEYSPKLSAHRDAVTLDPALFARIARIRDAAEDLDPESMHLLERYHLDRVLAGAELDEAGRSALQGLNQRLSRLSTRFRQQLQQSMEAEAVLLTEPTELAGLSDRQIASARAAAAGAGHEQGWLFPMLLPTPQPVLTQLADRAVRERVHRASVERAGRGALDNGPLAIEIARTRAERARLLGFENHAAAQVADQTAGSVATVDEMLSAVVVPAVRNAAAEAATLSARAAADGVELAAWDWLYYAEKIRSEQFEVDTASLTDWFELDRVLHDGVFHAATALYGITFRLRTDLAGYHPDVRVWEVLEEDGTPLGLFLGDFLARPGKRGGAWMDSLVLQSHLLGTRPVVLNNLNVPAPGAGEPVLLTLDEVDTLFHEFGHALHGLFSDVRYPRLSGTNVPRDFVEYPSQVNEMWVRWPQVLHHYARHVRTGEPIDAAVLDRLEEATRFGQGFGTTEFLAATVLDQAWHRIGPDEIIDSAQNFEAAALENAGLAVDLVPPRYGTTYFQHIFAGGYSAGYYSYLWSEILDAETVEWFTEHGGLDRSAGETFRRTLLGVGGSKDALQAFRDLRGRDADIGPLLRRRGLETSD